MMCFPLQKVVSQCGEECYEGTLTGMSHGKITLRIAGKKQSLMASEEVQVLASALIPSPVKVTVEGLKVIKITPKKLDM